MKKMIMVCVLLTPTLCWGGKFEGLLGVLSHVRTPLARVSQVSLQSGSNQFRQIHGGRRVEPSFTYFEICGVEKKDCSEKEKERLEALEKMGIRVLPSKIEPQEVMKESIPSPINPGQMNVCKGCLELKAENQFLKRKLADSDSALSALAKAEFVKGERFDRRVNYGLFLFALLVGAGFMDGLNP